MHACLLHGVELVRCGIDATLYLRGTLGFFYLELMWESGVAVCDGFSDWV